MYCVSCGTERRQNSAYCSNCGRKFEVDTNISSNNVDNKNTDNEVASIVLGVLGIAGSILIVFAPVAFILSLIGLIVAIINKKKKRSTAGIVLSSIGLFLSIVVLTIIIIIFNIIVNTVVDNTDNGENLYDKYREYAEKF